MEAQSLGTVERGRETQSAFRGNGQALSAILCCLISGLLFSVSRSTLHAKTNENLRIDMFFLVDISKSMLSTIDEALVAKGFATKKKESDGTLVVPRPERSEDLAKFLWSGVKPKYGIKRWAANEPFVADLLSLNKADPRVTNNILFKSIRKMEAIAGDYPLAWISTERN